MNTSTARTIADTLKTPLRNCEADFPITGVSSLTNPKPNTVAFWDATSRPDLVPPPINSILLITNADSVPSPFVHHPSPKLGFVIVARYLLVQRPCALISAQASIDPAATIGRNVSIGRGCVIESDVEIGDDVVIGEHVILRHAKIGRRCTIEAHSSIGADGWSSVSDETGAYLAVPHFSFVLIGDDTHIGSFVSIDRGSLDPTRIGQNVRVNDHTHIGHEAFVADGCKIAAMCAISGGTRIGDHCYLAPGVVTKGHVDIPARTVVGMNAIVAETIKQPGVYAAKSSLIKIR